MNSALKVASLTLPMVLAATAPSLAQVPADPGPIDSPAAIQKVIHQLKIGLFSAGAMSASTAKSLIDDMNAILRNAEAQDPNDRQCPSAQLELDGVPQAYPATLPIVVSSQSDMDLFAAAGYSVYAVQRITYCGGPASPGRIILGCARRGGPVLITTSQHPSIVILHEIGHGQGLGHYPVDLNNLMYPSASDAMRGITETQCKAFTTPQLFPLVIADQAQPDKPAAIMNAAFDLERSLRSDWIEGPPLEDIKNLTSEQLEQVYSFIRERKYQYWVNSIQIVGILPPQNAMELYRLVLNERPESHPQVIPAKQAAALSLGWYAKVTKSAEAGGLLSELATPEGARRFVEGSPDPDAAATGLFVEAVRAVKISGLEIPNAVVANQSARSRSGQLRLRISPDFFDQAEELGQRSQGQSLESIIAPQ